MKFSRDYVRTGGVGDMETTDLDRRSQDSVRLNGKVKEVDYKRTPPAYRAEFGDPKDEDNYILTDWLPAAGGRAQGDVDTHLLEVGERVTMLSEGGEFATGQLIPAGTYTKDDDRKAGADKAGLFRKKFSNGAEISYDRDSGDMVFTAEGKKKDDNGGQDRKIKGTFTVKAAGGTLVMKEGKLTVTFDGTEYELSKDGFKQTNGTKTHDGKNVGKDHKHSNVMPGSGETGDPEA